MQRGVTHMSESTIDQMSYTNDTHQMGARA